MLFTSPSRKVATSRPPVPAFEVTPLVKFNTPVRLASLGTRRLLALRMSAPNLNEWLPQFLVTLTTPWYWFSSSIRGQLQRPTLRPSPQLESVPSPWIAGSPEVNSAVKAP